MTSNLLVPFTKDRFGYYNVGQFKIYSKIEAIELQLKTGIHPEWHFNDEEFSQYDWTVEPDIAIDELYAMRARQIRDNYDYIVLFYSSGADSTNILNTFLRHNISFEEIASLCVEKGDGGKDTHFNQEIFSRALPNTLRICDSNLGVKHRLIDMTEITAKMYDSPAAKFDFLYDNNCMFSPNNRARAYLREYVDEYKDIIDSGRRLCFVWGCDKPRIFQQDGKLNVRFLDVIDGATGAIAKIQRLNRSWEHDELFYWSPDLPQLIIKQAHLIMKYLKTTIPTSADFTQTGPNKSFGSIEYRGDTFYLRDHAVHRILYGINEFHTVKPSSTFFSERDTWFLKNPDHIESARNYMQGIDKLRSIVPEYWVNGTFDRGIKGCMSKPYWLE